MEEWKDIPGYKGLYQASTQGRVRSLDREDSLGRPWAGKIRKLYRCPRRGYYTLNLTKDGFKVSLLVHRLIAETFIPNLEGLSQVNHRNGNKLDNSVGNLEWCTPSQNQKHAHATGLAPPPPVKKAEYRYIATPIAGGDVREFRGLGAVKAAGFTISSVSQCTNGLLRKHKGHTWSRRAI